jgi:tetratricopeptide (TPR) repeat protein
MDQIGTITQYFPFIDEETKNVLEAIMEKAKDYYDFVQRLGEEVLKTDSPIMVVYFAIHHSILAYDYKLIDRIREKYGAHQILGPNLFYASAYQGTVEDVKKVHEMADAILATNPENWIALEMNFMKFEADMRNYPTVMYQSATMDRIDELINIDPRYGFYKIILNDHLSIRAHADGDTERRFRCIEEALEFAEEFDDKYRIADLLIKKAYIIKDQDRKESRSLLEEAYRIADSSLGIPTIYAEIIINLSLMDAIRGDYDEAIKGCLKVVNIRERAGLNTGNASLYLSTFYNVIDDPESGVEWGRMAEYQFKSRPYLINRAILNQIWSLILLKRLTEAQVLIDTTRESILKSGDESQLAWLHFVTGLLEMAQNDLSLASESIEQALRIYEQQEWSYENQLIFLHHLAKIEVYSSDTKDVVSPSLAILEEKALSGDLPGFLGQVLLLKADIAIMNDDEALLREIIQKLRTLLEKENLQFLKRYYESLLRKL